MEPHEIDADPGAWLQDRLKRVSASEIGGIVGRAPAEYNTRFSLYWDKVAGVVQDPEEETDAQARGRHLEPYILERWAAECPKPYLDVRRGGYYASDLVPWQSATFDALGFDDPMLPATVVEIKSTQSAYGKDGELVWGDAGTDEIPDHYKCQVYQQMDIAGARLAYVVALFMHSWRIKEYVIRKTPDVEADMAYLRDQGTEFMTMVAEENPPDPLWTPGGATMRTLKRIYRPIEDRSVRVPNTLADRRLRLKDRISKAEDALMAVDIEIRHRMGTAKRAVALDTDGELRTVVSRSIYPRKAYEVKATEIDQLRPGNYGKER